MRSMPLAKKKLMTQKQNQDKEEHDKNLPDPEELAREMGNANRYTPTCVGKTPKSRNLFIEHQPRSL